jgi:hypothetical protein
MWAMPMGVGVRCPPSRGSGDLAAAGPVDVRTVRELDGSAPARGGPGVEEFADLPCDAAPLERREDRDSAHGEDPVDGSSAVEPLDVPKPSMAEAGERPAGWVRNVGVVILTRSGGVGSFREIDP